MATKSIKAPVTKAFDAITLLTADHRTVKALFSDYEKLPDNDDERKEALVQRICDELTVHAQVEEEIFYPAVRDAIDEGDLLDEAGARPAKSLIHNCGNAPDDLYDAKVKVFSEYIAHHVGRRRQMFTTDAQG
jgi:hemerythrin superfamily protein